MSDRTEGASRKSGVAKIDEFLAASRRDFRIEHKGALIVEADKTWPHPFEAGDKVLVQMLPGCGEHNLYSERDTAMSHFKGRLMVGFEGGKTICWRSDGKWRPSGGCCGVARSIVSRVVK